MVSRPRPPARIWNSSRVSPERDVVGARECLPRLRLPSFVEGGGSCKYHDAPRRRLKAAGVSVPPRSKAPTTPW